MDMSAFAVVPVKTLLKSKTRLSNYFTIQERPLFTLAMLEDVLNTLKSSKIDKTIVISSDSTVEAMVKNFGMTFLQEAQEGLNKALTQATRWCLRNGAELVLALPADAPLITSKDVNELVSLALKNSVIISPSLNGGTNALLQKPPGIISPCFGSDSFKRHISKARAKHVRIKIYVSANVLFDIDSKADLEQLLKMGQETTSYHFLKQKGLSDRTHHS